MVRPLRKTLIFFYVSFRRILFAYFSSSESLKGGENSAQGREFKKKEKKKEKGEKSGKEKKKEKGENKSVKRGKGKKKKYIKKRNMIILQY